MLDPFRCCEGQVVDCSGTLVVACTDTCCCENCEYERAHADEDSGLFERVNTGDDYDLELADRAIARDR